VLFLVLIAFLIGLHIMPLESSSFERAAQARLGEPVKIGSVHLALLPRPRLRMEQVAIGAGGEARIARVTATPELGFIWDVKKVFKSVELEGANLPQPWLEAVLWGKGRGDTLRVERVIAKGLKLDVRGMNLPPLDVDARLDAEGALQGASVADAERTMEVKLAAKGGKLAIEISGGPFKLPFGQAVRFDHFTGKGTLTPGQLDVGELEASGLDGHFSGNARLSWGANWSLEGQLTARAVDAGRIAAPLLSEGRIDGKGVYSMRAATPEKLEGSTHLEGTFTVRKGKLGTIDLAQVLQGSTTPGGSTLFSEMSGNGVMNPGSVQLRQLRLTAGLLSATGDASMDARKNLNGRFQLELRAASTQARASLALAGNLSAPVFKRQ
jgi:hypothetical protein